MPPQGAIPPQNNAYPYPPAPNPYGMPPQQGPMPPYGAVPPAGTAAYASVRPAEPDGGLSTAQYFWMLILFMLPIIGLVFMFYWAFAKGIAPARQRLARAFLIKTAVGLGCCLVMFALWGALVYALLRAVPPSAFSSSFGRYTAALVSRHAFFVSL
jgi:NADH:ubiquinone oxidoreductase subunit 3 (subunit A)